MKKVLEVKNLAYKNIFNNLNISFENNKIYSISSSNNSGKTTLIRILKREIELNNTIFFDNKDLSNFKIHELNKTITGVIPLEVKFLKDTLLEEIKLYTTDKKYIDYLVTNLNMKMLSKKKIDNLSKEEIVISQILLSLSHKPKVLLLDAISNYLSDKNFKKVMKFLKNYQEKYKITIIMTTNNLSDTLNTDYLYILNEGEVYLEGEPLEILEKDNILNKIGLDIPFMIDLSVKLRDYDLIENIELDKNRMVDILWK